MNILLQVAGLYNGIDFASWALGSHKLSDGDNCKSAFLRIPA